MLHFVNTIPSVVDASFFREGSIEAPLLRIRVALIDVSIGFY